jgi:hypothetical protein
MGEYTKLKTHGMHRPLVSRLVLLIADTFLEPFRRSCCRKLGYVSRVDRGGRLLAPSWLSTPPASAVYVILFWIVWLVTSRRSRCTTHMFFFFTPTALYFANAASSSMRLGPQQRLLGRFEANNGLGIGLYFPRRPAPSLSCALTVPYDSLTLLLHYDNLSSSMFSTFFGLVLAALLFVLLLLFIGLVAVMRGRRCPSHERYRSVLLFGSFGSCRRDLSLTLSTDFGGGRRRAWGSPCESPVVMVRVVQHSFVLHYFLVGPV